MTERRPETQEQAARTSSLRLATIAAAVAILIGSVTWAVIRSDDDDTIPADIDDWRAFASIEHNGWTIQVPPPWRIQELPACENAPERIGVVASNTDFEFRAPGGGSPRCEDRLIFAGFPRDGVALAFHPRGTIIGISDSTPLDTALPLTPDLLIRTDGIVGGPAHSFQSVNVHRATLGVIRRYVGPDAAESDVDALDRMLASLSIPGAPRWVFEDDVDPSSLRVSLRWPSSWQMWIVPLELGAPPPVVQLMSPGVVSGGCRVFPWAPRMRLDGLVAGGGVSIVLSEPSGSADPLLELPTQPQRFRFLEAQQERMTCGGHVRSLRFAFMSSGRPFYLDVAATWDLYRNEPEMLRYILDSIEISEA